MNNMRFNSHRNTVKKKMNNLIENPKTHKEKVERGG